MAARRLSELVGRYEWGVRDCLTTVGEVLRMVGAARAADNWDRQIASFRGGNEARTAAAAKLQHGSVQAAIEIGLRQVGMERLEGQQATMDATLPFDVVLLEDESPVWDASIGFVDEMCNVRVWSAAEGMLVVLREPKVKALFRAPMDLIDPIESGTD